MTWGFVSMLLVVVAVPGPDFIITLRNTVGGGPSRGTATALGAGTASALQGAFVSIGLGTLIVQSHPLFLTLKWIGVAYLAYLGSRSAWSAWRGNRQIAAGVGADAGSWTQGFQSGFLSNATNPKVLVFYLSLLPQFVPASASLCSWLSHAWMLPLLGTTWLLSIVYLGAALRQRLLRPFARRVTDTTAAIAFVGFGTRLTLNH